MTVVLFGLTGFGTTALRTLLRWRHEVLMVCTRREAGPYPYYDEIQLDYAAAQANIPVRYDGWRPDLGCPSPEVILVATYDRKLDAETIAAGRLAALNVHPSLLPKYPGRHPIRAALAAGDRWTGITIHRLTDRWDEGEILWQSKVPIPGGETEGGLRRTLAAESARAIASVMAELETKP